MIFLLNLDWLHSNKRWSKRKKDKIKKCPKAKILRRGCQKGQTSKKNLSNKNQRKNQTHKKKRNHKICRILRLKIVRVAWMMKLRAQKKRRCQRRKRRIFRMGFTNEKSKKMDLFLIYLNLCEFMSIK